MRFILHKPTSNSFSTDLVTKVNGVFLKYNITQFFGIGGKWDYGLTVRNEIQKYLDLGKEVIVSIMWGKDCGNVIWNNYRYLEAYEKHHEGDNPDTPKVYNKYPVVTDTAYLDKVRDFLSYLSGILSNIADQIILNVGGINQNTFELRYWNQDFRDTEDPNLAYLAGSQKHSNAGYTTELMREAIQRVLNDHSTFFPNTIKVVSPIAGTNGFPRINNDGHFNAQTNPTLVDDLISYMKWFPNFILLPTALTATSGTPINMVNSGLPMYYQLAANKFNKTTLSYDFEHAILNAKNNKGELIEVYETNVREHLDIIEKYK